MISRGEFGAVGCERILRLLEREGIPRPFSSPGTRRRPIPITCAPSPLPATRSVTTATCTRTHSSLETPEREREVAAERGLDALDRAAGVRPIGYRSPAWDNSPYTIELLLEQGFRYESSLMGNDFTPYWCRIGDVIQADGPYLFGRRSIWSRCR